VPGAPIEQSEQEINSEIQPEPHIQPVGNDEERFQKEAREIIHSSIVENHAISNVVLEINGLKYAYDTTFLDCAVIILQTLLDECKDEKDPTKLLSSLQRILQHWSLLLIKFVATEEDQVELIWILQEYCESQGKEIYKSLFPVILHTMYDIEAIEEDAIWKWVDEQKKEEDKTFLDLCKSFLEWLKQDDDEDEDDEDDE